MRKKMENLRYFQQHKNMDTLCLGFLCFDSIKRGSVRVKPRSFKVGLVFFIRVFSQFLLDPYYEPL